MRSERRFRTGTITAAPRSVIAASQENPRCPLCTCETASESWLGETRYLDRTYRYLQCARCASLFCSPMPDAETIAQMYGPSYAEDVAAAECADPKNPRAVVDHLRGRAPGVFVDYGCGDGKLLVAARGLDWNAIGVELSPEVANATEQRTGIRVSTPDTPGLRGVADVLHLGDVIEHLTNMDRQLGDALSVLKPGGILIAQGPLENNANLFTAVIRIARRLRKTITNMAPYHVMLATSEGQRALFARMNLESLSYSVTEEAWPAPARFFSGARGMTLYSLRLVSQAISAVVPDMGNRYFFVGKFRGQRLA